jgi:NAD(P)-dependent dehydrogenase (short-subunit alcohol dehydrogenase family)
MTKENACMSNSQIILITGCSSGIGRESAIQLKQRGHRVIATARKAQDVQNLLDLGFEAYQLDLSDSHSIQQAVALILEKTNSQIDVLFNNGAFGQPGAVEDLSRAVLRQQFETNLFGTHELTNLLIPIMRAQGHGRVIYNSSVLGLVAMSYRGAYNASKFALEGLADTLRLELHGTNIHISLIEPGPILTDFRKNSLALFHEHIKAEHSPHRLIYQSMLARLEKEGAAVPFTLPASAVTQKVLHAVESSKPKLRYYVTFPTYLFGYLKRILPTSWLDYLVRQV